MEIKKIKGDGYVFYNAELYKKLQIRSEGSLLFEEILTAITVLAIIVVGMLLF